MTGNPTIDGYIQMAKALAIALLIFLGAVYVLLSALAGIFAKTKAGPMFARWGADLRKVLVAAEKVIPGAPDVVKDDAEPETKNAPRTPKVPPLALLLLVLTLPLLQGCGLWAASKPVLSKADDIAASWCASHFSQVNGISLEDAAKEFCADEAQLRPWVKLILAGQKNGIATVGACGQ